MSVVYDAGVLVAADRNDRNLWADHRARLELGVVPATTAPVIAQVSRSDRQVQLRHFLRGCEVEGFEPGQSHNVGSLLQRAGTSDVIDAHLVISAARSASTVVTGDATDIELLASHLPHPVQVQSI